MSFRRFSVTFVLAFMAVMVCVGCAFAAPYLEGGHTSRVGMKDLKPDYDTAYFSRSGFEIYGADPSATGTLTLKGGNYAWWSYIESSWRVFYSVPAGQDKAFDLYYHGGEDNYYAPVDANKYEPSFRGGIETGLSEMEFELKVGSFSASGKMPKMRSTAQQLENYVPYIELVRDENNNAVGLKWRFVDPANPSKELVRDASAGIDLTRVGRIRVRLRGDGGDHYRERQNVDFKDGDKISEEREITFDTPVSLSQIQYVRINFENSERENGTNSRGYYMWEFTPYFDDDAPTLWFAHFTRTYLDNWKTNHNYDDGSTVPRFNNLYPDITPMFDEKSSIEIDFKNTTSVEFEQLVTWEVLDKQDFNGKTTFPTYRMSDSATHYLGNDGGAQAYFLDGAETALPGQSVSFNVGSVKRSGRIGNILSTADQVANGCIPFIEFDEAEIAAGKITKAIVRFVGSKGSTTAVQRDTGKHSIGNVERLEFRMKDRSRSNIYINQYREVGDLLEFEVGFSGQEFKLEDLYQVRLWFSYDDYYDMTGVISGTLYCWRFVIPGATQDSLASTSVTKPTAGEIDTVASDLGLDSAEIESVDEAALYTRVSEFYNARDIEGMENFDFSRTTSALLINQDVAPGGAVVMGSGTFLPFNAKAFDEESDMTVPKSFKELGELYSILKSFPGGGAIDLLDRYGEDLFEFAPDGVVFKAALAIVDGAAPGSAVKPMVDSAYGVEFNDAKTILYIYDGKEDGVAKDPISLTQKGEGGNGDDGGSSGCAAVGMFLPFALLASVCLLKKR